MTWGAGIPSAAFWRKPWGFGTPLFAITWPWGHPRGYPISAFQLWIHVRPCRRKSLLIMVGNKGSSQIAWLRS